MNRLRVNGYDMAFVEQGQGEPCVLVHGSLADQRYWAPQMAPLAEAGFRAIAVSLRHYWPEHWDGTGGDFTIARHVDDLAGFIAALDAGPVHLVGHSRGAHVAFTLAGQRPDLLRRLVLAEPAGALGEGMPPSGSLPANYLELIADAVARIRAGDIEGGLRSFFAYALGPGVWDGLPEHLKAMTRDNARTLLGQETEGRAPYTAAAARAIAVPTLLAGGALTRPGFVAILDALESTMPHVSRATVPAAGHAMNLQNPAAFDAAVIAFLRGR